MTGLGTEYFALKSSGLALTAIILNRVMPKKKNFGRKESMMWVVSSGEYFCLLTGIKLAVEDFKVLNLFSD